MSEKTAEEQVWNRLVGRETQLKELHERRDAAIDAGDDDALDAVDDEINNLPLSVEIVTTCRVVLSTGGPHDEFSVLIEPVYHDGKIVGWERADTYVDYTFMDWGGRDERRTDDDTVLGWIDGLIECMGPDIR